MSREGAPLRPAANRKWICCPDPTPLPGFLPSRPACSRPSPAPPPPRRPPSPECRPLGQVCRASPRTSASQSAVKLKRAQPRGRGQSGLSRVGTAERTSARAARSRALASARRRPRPPQPPAAPRHLPLSFPAPCPADQLAQVAVPAESGGHRPAPSAFSSAAQRLHEFLLLLLLGPGAWALGPLPTQAQLHFSPPRPPPPALLLQLLQLLAL